MSSNSISVNYHKYQKYNYNNNNNTCLVLLSYVILLTPKYSALYLS